MIQSQHYESHSFRAGQIFILYRSKKAVFHSSMLTNELVDTSLKDLARQGLIPSTTNFCDKFPAKTSKLSMQQISLA